MAFTLPHCLKGGGLPVAMPPLPKGALLAGGKRLAPTEADSGDRVLRQ